ncbi:MAG: pyridoxal phosphate-dependent aminotransferase [Clostridia bacterium]|jgi:aspartate aminotransferase|nr:pyridoxal phosphate-dependent aminotransferase [Clostridiales bacterium]
MVSKSMYALGAQPSGIRELFEFGRQRAKEVGAENVFDFSLGNPSIPAPGMVAEAISKTLTEVSPVAVHGYTSAAGSDACRDAIAENLNSRYSTGYTRNNVFITCGAAPALVATFRALADDDGGSEFIVIAPFFPEYRVFIGNAGGKPVIVPPDTDRFQIDFNALETAINERTAAVLINSPNNPSGVVYTEGTIKMLAKLLEEKSREFGHPIFLVSDEPYRELVYGDVQVPFVPNYYDNTIVCYSFSKSLSLPGERIGYVLVPDSVEDARTVFLAVAGSARSMGHVCAPSLMQHVITACINLVPDVAVYQRNANLLYDALTSYGYNCAKPDGAFYLFFEAPCGISAPEFSDFAKERYNVLVVPGDSFGCPNWLRLSYCVETERIKNALPRLKQIIDHLKEK